LLELAVGNRPAGRSEYVRLSNREQEYEAEHVPDRGARARRTSATTVSGADA
jgi:hypothetical protein